MHRAPACIVLIALVNVASAEELQDHRFRREQGPEIQHAHSQRRQNRSTRRRLQMDRRAALGQENNALLFTDIPNNRVVRWSAKDGVKDFLKPSGYTGTAEFKSAEPGANGLTFDKDGNLILCQHGDRRIAKLAKDGKSFETLVDKYMGKRLNSPNDLVFAKNGDLYFTDPPYGLPEQVKDPAKELDFQGVYRLSAKGELTLLTKEMSRPNGIGLRRTRRLCMSRTPTRKKRSGWRSRSMPTARSARASNFTTPPKT